jgi:hypothetical protein
MLRRAHTETGTSLSINGTSFEREVQKLDAGLAPVEAEIFYAEVMSELKRLGLPFLVGGGYAVSAYAGLKRQAKDIDLFTTAGEFPAILGALGKRYEVIIEDERWIAKLIQAERFVDVIFGSANGQVPVTAEWFENAVQAEILRIPVLILSPTELIWSKVFIRDRCRYDGADIVHTILTQHDRIDWDRLLSHMDAHWEILLSQLLEYRWAYPSERHRVPDWLLHELIRRIGLQLNLPQPVRRVCRGRILSRLDYRHAIDEWGFADIGGEERTDA